ncbi:hypothetical protein LNAOJCKE_3028 [Methylorubrum aminovorans]|uniref:Uncharacterized protein n=1 Tax=Methylorubrum aminovorans TaxID=269069 RepID=A0ABQ4UER8_9HYPH|nr:hypothetical protein [Methylorubrum aminovorans]GJE65815.1 hypothetical protein LNAOJCKE_3028 [Methylorubrum aminovorans]GMA75833.1 hypothetical protein GCM10025880_22500 [Methylorubrum aminovorans]
MPQPTDYWIDRLDGAFAVFSASGIELEGIESRGDAQNHILDLIERDRVAAQEEIASLADFEAQHFAEAA